MLSLIELISVKNFALNKEFWIFGPNLPNKCIAGLKATKGIRIRISLGTFQLKVAILNFEPNFSKKGISKTGKVNIDTNVLTKFYFKQFWVSWLNFAQQEYFWSKTEKMNHNIEFSIANLI